MSYNSHIIENITGISYGATGNGIKIINPTIGFKMSNLIGYNLSPTGGTSAYGIGIYSPDRSEGSAAILIDSIGRSYAGNGILAHNIQLKRCIGYASYSISEGGEEYHAFKVVGDVILDECSSNLGNSINAVSLYIGYSIYGNTTNVNGCNFVGKSAGYFIKQELPEDPRWYDIRIKNSVLESASTYGAGISGTTAYYNNIEIDNCTIKGYSSIIVCDGSSINNNIIEVKNPNSYGISSTDPESRVSYSNNTIIGATTTNGGISPNIYQGIPPQTAIDSYGNISYSKIDTTGLVLYLDSGRTNSYPGSGTSLFDISPTTSNTATLTGVTYTSSDPGGSDGGSLFFDGTDFGTIVYNESLNLTTAITIEAFVKFSNFSSNPNIINKDSNQGWRIRVNSAGRPEFISNAAAIQFLSTETVSTNQWLHLVATFNSSGGNWYVDGATAGTTSTPYAAQNTVGGSTYLGQFTGGTDRLIGNLGLIRVYNRKLGFREVRQNFLADRDRYGIATP
jgi:hypothetical protein